jgi:hypothetical protein
MTWTSAADAVVPACAHACPHTAEIVTGFTATAFTLPGRRGPVRPAARGPAGRRVAAYGCDAFPAARGPGCRPGRLSSARAPRQCEPWYVRAPDRSYPLRTHLATPGWPSDPGRHTP